MSDPQRQPLKGTLILAVAAACLSALSGCSMAPEYVRPEPRLPTVLGGTAVAPSEGQTERASLAPDEARFLTSLGGEGVLPGLVAQALVHNSDFNSAVDNVRLARAALAEHRAALAPQVMGTVQAEKYGFSNSAVDAAGSSNYGFGGLAVHQDLDIFGRAQGLSAAARERLGGQEHMQEAARAALIVQVVRTYVASIAAKEGARAAATIVEDSRASADAVKLSAKLGAASMSEVTQADLQFEEALTNQRSAEAATKSVERALGLLVGYQVRPESVGTEAMANLARRMTLPENVPSSVLLRTPEVMAAESELRARNADIGAARAAFFPSISLTGAYGRISDGLGNLFSDAATGWAFLPQIDIPIFDFGQRKANLDAAWVRKQAGVREYEAAVERAFKTASDAIEGLTVAQARSDVALQRVSETEKRLTSAQERASRGLEDASTVRRLRAASAHEQMARIQADSDLIQARADLYSVFHGTDVLK
ncbi:efflux transporter outer membrane subunit [Stenotrophomonas maltophilia]|uniref:efflux transporter outer membrane subunit n=1 Tax=Stenotrophomonas maltophilia TaxID=40324 RepID=UPI0025542E59|nr:efflux transporter outer membrane subunit [Stenotrophomonas maltophilia]